MFKELFISNYIQNKTTFIPFGYLKNDLYPMYNISMDGSLEEDETIDDNYITIGYDYDYMYNNVATYDIYRNVEECLLNEELREQIDTLLEILNDKEETVIRMRFGLVDDRTEYTLDDIARELRITRERVRQIESRAITKLKHLKVNRTLKHYVFDIDKTIKDNSRFEYISNFWINIIKHYNNYIYSKCEPNVAKNKIVEDFKIRRIANDIMNIIGKLVKSKDKIYIDTSNKDNIIFEIFRKNLIITEMIRKDMIMRIFVRDLDLSINMFIGEKRYELSKYGRISEI